MDTSVSLACLTFSAMSRAVRLVSSKFSMRAMSSRMSPYTHAHSRLQIARCTDVMGLMSAAGTDLPSRQLRAHEVVSSNGVWHEPCP